MPQQALPDVDLAGLIGRDSRLSGYGKRRTGPCPRCGGQRRIKVNTELQVWHCEHCHPKWSGAAGYVMWRDGVPFREAVAMLESRPIAPIQPPEPAPLTEDDRAWFATLAYQAHRNLIGTRGVLRRQWLAERGIDDGAIRLWGLGYNPQPVCTLRAGHTIPLQGVDGQIHGLTVRQHEGTKYMALSGSRVPLFGQPGRPGYPLLLVEGQFDAILLHRVVGDLVDVAALGTAKGQVERQWLGYLVQHARWLLALDNDKAGAAALEVWRLNSQRVVPCPTPDGFHDPSAMWQAEATRWDAAEADACLRAWISAVLLEVG